MCTYFTTQVKLQLHEQKMSTAYREGKFDRKRARAVAHSSFANTTQLNQFTAVAALRSLSLSIYLRHLTKVWSSLSRSNWPIKR